MSFKKNWDVGSLASQIHSMGRECSNPYNDGFTSFEIKKELYELKFVIDDILRRSPNFAGEEQWLTAQEQKRIIRHLKS
jgi:hypothetical protein